MNHNVSFSAQRALLVIVFAGATAGLVGATSGPAVAEEAQRTPFQAMPPVLARPPQVSANVPYEADVVEADPEQQNRRARRTEWLEDLERLEGPERFDAFEPVAVPDRIDRPQPVERLTAPERPTTVERPTRVERPTKVEKPTKVSPPSRVARPPRVGRRGR